LYYYFQHPSYGSGSGAYPNDISLIRVSSPISLNGNTVQKIDLAAEGTEHVGNGNCYISGWGVTTTGGGCMYHLIFQTETA